MLLRNLDPLKLSNGKLTPFVLVATVTTGVAAGQDVCTPRIPLIPSDMPFEFRRLQFPVKLSYAISINKS